MGKSNKCLSDRETKRGAPIDFEELRIATWRNIQKAIPPKPQSAPAIV